MPKIAIIGAGSMVFSRNLISDILAFDALKGTTFALMDIDAERLKVAGAMAESINRTRGADAKVVVTPDRREAVSGADCVINTIGVGGFSATKTDFDVPERFGLRQVIADTDCGPIPEPEKEEMIFELDAVAAHLYGLAEAHVRHIFETFHEGWDYHDRLDAVLRYYRQWAERRV